MRFIKCENFFFNGMVNLDHVVEVHTEQMYIDGKPLENVLGVVAQLQFGYGERILFMGNAAVCKEYMDELVKEA